MKRRYIGKRHKSSSLHINFPGIKYNKTQEDDIKTENGNGKTNMFINIGMITITFLFGGIGLLYFQNNLTQDQINFTIFIVLIFVIMIYFKYRG